MLTNEQLRLIALEVARTALAPHRVENALVDDTVDAFGNDALGVMLVIPSEAVSRLDGDTLIQFLIQLRERFEREGEQRRPIVEYATPEDLTADADPES